MRWAVGVGRRFMLREMTGFLGRPSELPGQQAAVLGITHPGQSRPTSPPSTCGGAEVQEAARGPTAVSGHPVRTAITREIGECEELSGLVVRTR